METMLGSSLRLPKRVALAEGVADSIAWAISTGALKPDEKLGEARLAEETGVSRLPIREGLKILHAQGIVVGEQNRGYRVAQFDPKTVTDVLEIRIVLEKVLLRDAIANWRDSGDHTASGLAQPIEDMRDAAAKGDRTASLAADLAFHRVIAEAADNWIARTLWEAIARHTLIIFNRREYRDDDLASVVVQHERFREEIARMIAEDASVETIHAGIQNHLLQIARGRA